MSATKRLRALYLLDEHSFGAIYGPQEREDIQGLVDIVGHLSKRSLKAQQSLLSDVDIILSGWGMPMMDEAFLEAAPQLQTVFYGAGSVRGFVTEASWARGVRVISAWAANAKPVAEYTLSQIIFCLKHGWSRARNVRDRRGYEPDPPVPGAYLSTVGIVSLGMIGRRVCHLLKEMDVQVIAYDPFVTEGEARALGVELCALGELFARADVVSLHTPLLEDTLGMIGKEHFEIMKPGAAFINTSRGAVVRESELVEVLTQRPDLQAVLDVTWPEPPPPESPLFDLPNVVVTPHIAGSQDGECRRMGRYMVEELTRYLNGEPLRWELTRTQAEHLA
ncbi:MAG: hydroxyacid dehydrogenase [Armatimonadetes bacterium]|nr:hydroxyacid dehydrogenase [Armatimonadota bacterium]